MTEQEAIRLIEHHCRSKDIEANGSELDRIINDFLRLNGFKELAKCHDSVDHWRA